MVKKQKQQHQPFKHIKVIVFSDVCLAIGYFLQYF